MRQTVRRVTEKVSFRCKCAASQLCFRHYLVDKYAAFSEPVGPRKTPHNAGVCHEPSP